MLITNIKKLSKPMLVKTPTMAIGLKVSKKRDRDGAHWDSVILRKGCESLPAITRPA
jgi:hypothetical protein